MPDIVDAEAINDMFRSDEEKQMAARITDLIRQTLQAADPHLTGFLDPAQQDVVRRVMQPLPDVRYVMYGGYRGAERKRAIIMPSYFINEYLDFQVGAMEIVPEAEEADLAHRDYLGAVLSLGLNRDRVGDIVVLEDRCQAFIDASVQEFIVTTLTRVGRFRVTVEAIDPERVDVAPERVQEIERTVASLRLDSVAAAGYSTSRTKMAKEIKARQVKLNWNQVMRPDVQVEPGDVISISGRGRVLLEEVVGETKKGRIRIRLKKLQ